MHEDAIGGRAAALAATRKALVHMAQLDGPALCEPDAADVLGKHVRSASIAGGYGAAQRVDSVAEAFAGRDSLEQIADSVIDTEETGPGEFDPV